MEASKVEQRDVVQFVTPGGVGRREIHLRISAFYGERSMLFSRLLEEHNAFRVVRVTLKGGATYPGTDSMCHLSGVIAEIDDLIWGNRRINFEERHSRI